MSGSYDAAELTLFQHIVELAAIDLGIKTEEEKSLMAARVVAAADRGERDFDLLMAAAKVAFPRGGQRSSGNS